MLKLFSVLYPEIELGLSDHTLGDETVLGAVALGAKYIEKHFMMIIIELVRITHFQ